MNRSQASACAWPSISSPRCAAVPTNCCRLVMAMTSSDRQVFGFSVFRGICGSRPPGYRGGLSPGDAGVAGRIDIRQWAVGVVVAKVVAPYLLKHGDRRGAADLLVTNVPGFLGGHFGSAAEYGPLTSA